MLHYDSSSISQAFYMLHNARHGLLSATANDAEAACNCVRDVSRKIFEIAIK